MINISIIILKKDASKKQFSKLYRIIKMHNRFSNKKEISPYLLKLQRILTKNL